MDNSYFVMYKFTNYFPLSYSTLSYEIIYLFFAFLNNNGIFLILFITSFNDVNYVNFGGVFGSNIEQGSISPGQLRIRFNFS